ncbi:hypothetical protein A2154_04325 [Candidatus Gottesmanbacteria bacterium RBG_16_43_7]|uniref:Urease accessory protein UreH-like transmembrane domain-containing protein n=1 Tax=Candidatus Gottesmanbacteria bacterium RBG_16_43_7 TaxID=1798373 RepID=A0A1F5ZC95_9BACT|nr:MAG: hypothetical protein A2154_04325 [Candidatus Gottesmanbacteria bacterium RBG_16_43_7]
MWLVFTTGLLTGGLTCMAVQGSLLATALLTLEQKAKLISSRSRVWAISAFLLAKLVAYTLLGALLGWFGSMFTLSIPFQFLLTLAVAVFMLGCAGNILGIHPIFRYFALTPPRFVSRFIRSQSKAGEVFTPILLGALTVFIPCGTTQAMMVLSMGTGNPIWGALVLDAFVLGTIPVFFILGLSLTSLKDIFQARFRIVAATLIILLALWNVNSALTLTGTIWTIQGLARRVNCVISFCDSEPQTLGQATTETPITIGARGYSIDQPVIKAGAPITVHLINTDGANCAQSFTIPSYNIQKVVPLGERADVTFIAPQKPGKLAFMCSMGMYRGEFIVR